MRERASTIDPEVAVNNNNNLTRPAARLAAAVGFVVALLSAGRAAAIPIDLNAFYHDPAAPVTVAADGSTATLGESAQFGSVVLDNIPGFGDSEVIVAGDDHILSFDFSFTMPANNADIFHFGILDGLTGDILSAAYEGFEAATGGGHVSFDLSSLVGLTLGLRFELLFQPEDLGLDSTVTISNLALSVPEPPPPPPPPVDVPEPPVVLLLLMGGLALVTVRMRRRDVTFFNEVTRA